ncbi:MAG: hypothetical protein JWM86_1781 [Thermoleophilia bacterium]|nr:hypothetical protein [Thermoleophilia bacterium]
MNAHPETERALRDLFLAYEQMDRAWGDGVTLTLEQQHVLLVLSTGCLSPDELARAAELPGSVVTDALDGLVQSGHAQVFRHPSEDGRSLVSGTKRGMHPVMAFEDAVQAMALVDEASAAPIVEFLDRAAGAARERAPSLSGS